MATANEMPTQIDLSPVTKGSTPFAAPTNPTTTTEAHLPATTTTTTTMASSKPTATSGIVPNGLNDPVTNGHTPAAASFNGQQNVQPNHKPTPSADTTATSATTDTNIANAESTPLSPASTTPTLEKEPADLDFAGNVDVNDDIPTAADLKRAGELLILDSEGQSRQFKELYTSDGVAPRQLIIFIRHFFCGNCQEYLRTLSASLSPSLLLSLPTPTFISVVGCGSPSLIPMYAEATSCPFPIYAEPTRKLYDYLGMTRTLDPGSKKPEYMKRGMVKGAVKSIWQGVSQGNKALKGGDFKQVGGEFLFEDGVLEKVHRMRNTRDHLEVLDVKSWLEIGEGDLERLEAGGGGLEGSGDEVRGVRKRWSRGMKEKEKEKEKEGKRSASWGRVRAASWKRGEKEGKAGSSGTVTPEEKVIVAERIDEKIPEKIPEEAPAVKAI